MCGICGFSGATDQRTLLVMMRALVHRGPDDHGMYAEGGINLGFQRLSIVDLETGNQPIFNEDASIIAIFNGEIYNHVELRRTLEQLGHEFRSRNSDSETIVHLYEEYGDEWPSKANINGMFAVAIWDQNQRRLLLYRDRVGKKPLYWAKIDSDIIFGSEPKAILSHPKFKCRLNHGAVNGYFGLKNTSAPNSAFQDMFQVQPGHYLVWENCQAREFAYWQPQFDDSQAGLTENEAADHLFELLEDAVVRRMNCDVPYGAFLSGGVDSSLVVSIMQRHQKAPISTFCLGYENESGGQFDGKKNDIASAREVSRQFSTKHHEYILGSKEFTQQLPQVLSAFDEPYSGTISTYYLSTLISKHVKVALSGDGADEIFGSYLTHRLANPIQNLKERYGTHPPPFDQLSAEDKTVFAPFDEPGQYEFMANLHRKNSGAWRHGLVVFSEIEKRKLLNPAYWSKEQTNTTESYIGRLSAGSSARDALNISLEIDQRELLANQVLAFMDRLSMAHSLEIRSPFLDHRILDFANALPGSMKIKGTTTKHLLKLAARKVLPDKVVYRPKEGFVQPIYTWLKSHMRDWIYDLLAPSRLSRAGILKGEFVRELLDAHFVGQADHSAKLWNIVCFQVWYDDVYEKYKESAWKS